MPSPDYFLTVGDRLPVVRETLIDPDGTPRDLTGCTVQFRIRRASRSISATGGSAVIVGDPGNGTVEYDWTGADTLVDGRYLAEWIVTAIDGRQTTYPNDRPITIQIRSRVG